MLRYEVWENFQALEHETHISYFHVKKLILIGWETFDKNQYYLLNHETTP